MICPCIQNTLVNKRVMKRIKNKIKNKIKTRIRYYLNGCDIFLFSVVTTGVLFLAFLGVISLLLFTTCRQAPINNKQKETLAKDTLCTAHYRRPEIPQMMTDPQQRAFYYVKHYWDEYSLADTAFIHSDDTELLFADFVDALQYVSPQENATALRNMMNLMEADSMAYAHFCLLSEKYLYDPNSPMRNEDSYIRVLEQMLASHRLTEAEKIRPADRLKQAHKNRPGTVAANFTYVTPSNLDKVQRMSNIKADYTMLFFYDPDCSNCRKYEQVLSEIPAFLEMQQKGTLRVLAVYPDEDGNQWLLNSSKMPEGWIVGWNKKGDIRSKQLYEIRATPTLYLLDKQKKVIVKDASLEWIIQYLAMVTQNSNLETTHRI